MPTYKLTYFDARGLAETSRLLFALADVPFEDIRIPFHWGSKNEIPEEIKQKLPFGQVPFLEIGNDQNLSQSMTIARYLAKKFNFYGSDALESAKIDEILDAAKDYGDNFRAVHMAKGDEEKAAAKKNVMDVATPKYIGKFEQILQKNGTGFLVGPSVTLADLHLFNLITAVKPHGMDVVQDYPGVAELVTKIGDIPQIKQWIAKRPQTMF